MSFTMSGNLDVRLEEIAFTRTLERIGLADAWHWICQNNPSGDLPYHSNEHLFHVARIANTLLMNIGYYDVHLQRVLIAAALFHDYDHGGGTCSDDVNIANAIVSMRVYFEDPTRNGWVPPAPTIDDIARIISITEFPFKSDPNSILACCIRDADLLYGNSSARVGRIMDGLRTEMETALGRPIDDTEMLERQRVFYANAQMFTDLGHLMWMDVKSIALKAQAEHVAKGTPLQLVIA